MNLFNDDETWKDILGYEGLYQVSNLGRIKSIAHFVVGSNRFGTFYNRMTIGRILRFSINKSGYYIVHLCKDSNKSIFTVHSIVALMFIGVRPSGYHVNHRDGNKLNNYSDNLEYVTPRENCLHAIRCNLKPRQTHTKLSESDVIEILNVCRKNSEYKQRDGKYIPKRNIAKRFNVSVGLISFISNGHAWKHINPDLAQPAEAAA